MPPRGPKPLLTVARALRIQRHPRRDALPMLTRTALSLSLSPSRFRSLSPFLSLHRMRRNNVCCWITEEFGRFLYMIFYQTVFYSTPSMDNILLVCVVTEL